MKKIYKVNDCNAEGMGKPWEWSRITMACPLLTLVMILMLGAWSVPAWGKYDRTEDKNPQYRCKDCSINKMKTISK